MKFSEKKIREWLDLDRLSLNPYDDAAFIKKTIDESSLRPKDAVATLETINKVIEAHGVDSVEYNDEVYAVYINTGDMYNATVLYDVMEQEFYLTTLADFIEKKDRRG